MGNSHSCYTFVNWPHLMRPALFGDQEESAFVKRSMTKKEKQYVSVYSIPIWVIRLLPYWLPLNFIAPLHKLLIADDYVNSVLSDDISLTSFPHPLWRNQFGYLPLNWTGCCCLIQIVNPYQIFSSSSVLQYLTTIFQTFQIFPSCARLSITKNKNLASWIPIGTQGCPCSWLFPLVTKNALQADAW